MELLDKEVFVYELNSIPLGRPNTNKKYMDVPNISEQKDKKAWLQRLKDESWEAELLISTVAIFGTVQLFKLTSWTTDFLINILSPSQYFLGYAIVSMGLMAVSVLTTMFVIHFLLRAYWVGLVGLNSVFPDYSLENSPYSDLYTSKMLALLPKLKDTIPEVDDLCSVIFSAAFVLFGMYAYLSILSFLLLEIYLNLGLYISTFVWDILLVVIVLLSITQFAVLTLANLKRNKEVEWIQNLFFKTTKYSNKFLLGPLYKPMLQIFMAFGTNFKKKKSLVVLMLVFFFVGIIVTVVQFNNSKGFYLLRQDLYYNEAKLYNSYYADSAEKDCFLLGPQIDSDIINQGVLKLFVPKYKYESRLLDKLYDDYVEEEGLSDKEQGKKERAYYLNMNNDYHEVFLNGKPVEVKFMQMMYPNTNQSGLLGYVNLEGETSGRKELKIIKKLGEENTREWVIPFQYVRN